MSTALAVAPPRRAPMIAPPQATYAELERIAHAFAASGMFEDGREVAQCFVKILAGREWAIGPMASMTQIFMVKNRPTMSASLIGATIKRSGIYDYKLRWMRRSVEDRGKTTEVIYGCELTFLENGEPKEEPSTFTVEDAAQAGLLGGDNWKKYPRNMLFSRALTNGARWYCTDVFSGAVYTPDELDNAIALDASGVPLKMPQFAADMPQGALTGEGDVDLTAVPTVADIRALYEKSGLTGSVGAWMKSVIQSDLNDADPFTGKKIAPTPAALIKAKAVLSEIIAKREPQSTMTLETTPAGADVARDPAPKKNVPLLAAVLPPRPVPTTPAAIIDTPSLEQTFNTAAEQAQMSFADATGTSTAEAMMSDAQRKKIMAMFNERGFKVPAHRHAFAAAHLGEAKKSSSTWKWRDAKLIIDKLELIPPTKQPTL